MALPDYGVITVGTAIRFIKSATYNPAAANVITPASPTPTDVAIDMTSIGSGTAVQSAAFDFGASWAQWWSLMGACELAATPTSGARIECYLAPSRMSTAAYGKPGGVSGSSGAYSGYSSNLDGSLRQLQFIGRLTTTVQATGTVQIVDGGIFRPRARYGALVVVNLSGASWHNDMVESCISFEPLVNTQID